MPKKWGCAPGMFGKRKKHQVNGRESAETPNSVSSPVVKPDSTDSLPPNPEETRDSENKESKDMYKTSTTIEVNGSPKKDTPSRSTGSCSTTIVVNTSPKIGPKVEKKERSKVVENGEAKGDRNKSEPTTPTHTVPGSPSSTRFTPPPQGPMFKAKAPNAVWTPGQTTPPSEITTKESDKSRPPPTIKYRDDESGPVWQPFGAVPEERIQFKSIKLETSTTKVQKTSSESGQETGKSQETSVKKMTQKLESVSNSSTTETNGTPISPTSPFSRLSTSKLPQSQSPTVILLQKAREGQIPKGALYIDESNVKDGPYQDGILIDQKKIIDEDRIHTDSYYALPIRDVTSTTKIIPAPAKYQGIGPTERGIPTCLRTDQDGMAVKDEYASDWYKTMYRSLHKSEKSDADYVTLKFNKKGHVPHAGGYMSEPEIDKEDEYPYKFSTVDYRKRPERTISENIQQRTQLQEKNESQVNPYLPASTRLYQDVYRNQPRSIADYEPGNSSISEREERMFWADFWEAIDEMEKDDGGDSDQQKKYLPPMNQPKPSYVYRDGYESDSTLFRRTGKAQSLDPLQQKVLYRKIQQGSDIPFSGLGKPAPEKVKDNQTGCKLNEIDSMPKAASSASPHKYQETEVNIHYRSPIRTLEKEFIEEEELRKRQEEAMKRFYEEERYKKQLQQLAEIENRRHNDYFIPSQKSPIPLNRYDNPFELSTTPPPPKTPESRTMGRALFSFTAQTARELSFNKGDIVYVIRKIDKNWYEGEHHGMIGIFPINYIEVIPPENANLQPRKATEGLARVKFNFRAQTPVELSLFKGEKVCLMRRVDQNWYEGRIGTKKGILPSSYVEILREPEERVTSCVSPKPPASPVYGPIVNGSHTTRQTHFLHSHSYPQGLSTNDTNFHTVQEEKKRPLTQSLHIDTSNDPIPYRSLYNYRPQNEDELELQEGDTIYVMEKCDDGWYVGTSLRTGLFGTFPGNYVERIW